MRTGWAVTCGLLVSMMVGLTGCASTGEVASDAKDATNDAVNTVEETRTTSLHGKWRSSSGEERPASITVEQHALTAKLIVALDGHVCLAESIVEAKVTIEGVKTTADVAGMHLELEGEPGLEEVIGNFEAIKDGPCPGQGGWLAVTR
jgi:hypothetical protein